MMKRLIALVAAVMLLMTGTALAAVNTTDLNKVVDFKFFKAKDGIGCGVCPVYTAPDENAYRVGKAACGTDSELFVLGYDNGWLMVRYKTNNGNFRAGYIPPKYVSGVKSKVNKIIEGVEYIKDFSFIQRTAEERLYITDNPLSVNPAFSSFGIIEKETPYWILGQYTYYGNWWFVESYINGQKVRGFIDRTGKASAASGAVAGNGADPTLNLGTVTVKAASIVRQDANPDTDMVARAAANQVYPYYEQRIGSTDKPWYYINVNGVWGWISSTQCQVN